MVTTAEANRILEENKVIAMNLSWRFERNGYRIQANVLSLDSDEMLSFRGYVGKTNRSFALLYRNLPIRKYTVHDRHIDPVTSRVFKEPHKHSWDDVWEDKRVYIPNDIRIGNPNEEMMDFLKECNISLRGYYRAQAFFQEN